jgi:hypothetical protein
VVRYGEVKIGHGGNGCKISVGDDGARLKLIYDAKTYRTRSIELGRAISHHEKILSGLGIFVFVSSLKTNLGERH